MTYWDTSAVLKLYVAEPDSRYFLDLNAETDEAVVSSAIVTVEALSAFYRKQLAGDLRPGAANAVYQKFAEDVRAGRIVTVPYGDDVRAEAEKLVRLAYGQPRPLLVRSLDLIHVASALTTKAKRFITTDQRLAKLALLARIAVLPQL